ncbi:hypothetical protein BGX34_011415, partial [Mortierella sp. NVP85]
MARGGGGSSSGRGGGGFSMGGGNRGSSSSGGGGNAGTIVLIVLGTIVGFIIVGLVPCYLYRKRRSALIEANKKKPG